MTSELAAYGYLLSISDAMFLKQQEAFRAVEDRCGL
jgi:hypothetical protein